MHTSDESVLRLHRDDGSSSSSLKELERLQSSIERDVLRDEEVQAHTTLFQRIKGLLWEALWPDLILSHLDPASLKIVLRSWLMMWSLTILCVCDRTAVFMGPSSFLANFAAGIEIAGNLSVSSAFVYCMGDLVSMIFAFLVSVVTLGISWRVRGYPTEQDILRDLIAEGRCAGIANPDFTNCIEPEMHRGHFLETRVTAITVFGMLFSFTMCGYFQCVSKYGKLAWLLNSLYTIIVFPFNNMMPLWKPWYFARNCVVPMAMAFATRFFVSLVIFPFSSNYKVVSSLATACSRLRGICEKMQGLETKPSSPEFTDSFEFINADTQSVFTKLIVNEVDMEMVNNLEVWFSHFEKVDLCELRSQVRLIMSALSSFYFFFESMADSYTLLAYHNQSAAERPFKLRKFSSTWDKFKKHRITPEPIVKVLEQSRKETGVYERRQKRNFYRNLRAEFSGEVENSTDQQGENISSKSSADTGSNSVELLDQEYYKVIESFKPLLKSSCELLNSISQWLHQSCHVLPWLFFYGRESRNRLYQQCFERLCEDLERHSKALKLAKSLGPTKDQNFALYSYLCIHFARRVKRLSRWCILIHHERPTPTLSWPFKQSMRSTFPSADGDDSDDVLKNVTGNAKEAYTSFKPTSQVQARNPDATPPRSVLHIIGIFILKLKHCFYDPVLLFNIKRAGLTVVTLIPYFCRTTCGLAYRHWFLWVAVLTTYTVARQAVDGIYGLLAKFVYNFSGCLVGMVAWYISAGSGRGNPFSYAAVTAFVWLYICFQRQFNKHFVAGTSVVYSCTVTLVLGNSWNSGHIYLPGVELGRGFSPAWIRFVTVTIGISISFLGTILPYAYTAKRAVRANIAKCLGHLGDLQASISNFGIQRYNNPSTHIVAHTDVITGVARALITSLASAETLRKRIIYEPPLSGNYPTHLYKLLINYIHETTLLYTLVYAFMDELEDPEKVPQILRVMGWTDPQISSGVYSLVYMSCRAIEDGIALPSVTSGNLVEQHIAKLLQEKQLAPTNGYSLKLSSTQPDLITAVALSSQIYERLDGVIILIKELVGEAYDVRMDLFDLDLESRILRHE